MSFRCLNSFCNDAPGNSSCRGDAANVAGSKGTVEHDNTSTLSAMHVCKRLFKCHHTISRQNGGQTGSTIAHKHTLPQGATCYSVACLLSAIQPNSNAIRKASRAPITGTRCRHCTHVLTRVVHSQTGSHAPTRIFPAAAQLQGVTLQVVQYLTLVTLARASFHFFATYVFCYFRAVLPLTNPQYDWCRAKQGKRRLQLCDRSPFIRTQRRFAGFVGWWQCQVNSRLHQGECRRTSVRPMGC